MKFRIGMKAIALPRRSAEKDLRSILRSGIVDKTRKITADSAYVYVPVLADPCLPSHWIVDVDLQEIRLLNLQDSITGRRSFSSLPRYSTVMEGR